MGSVIVLADTLLAFLALALLYAHTRTRTRTRKQRGAILPPGPRRWPIVGHLFAMPRAKEWEVYAGWSRTFCSDVVHAEVLGTHVVVVNSAKAARELFERRSSLYSDRPWMATEYLGLDWVTGFIPYSPKWRRSRRGLHIHFHPDAAAAYRPTELEATRHLLRNLLRAPEDFVQHLRHMAGEVVLAIAYGIEVKPRHDPHVALAESVIKGVIKATSMEGRLLDMIPFLRSMPWWFPGAGFKKTAERFRGVGAEMVDAPYNAARAATVRGDAPPSVAAATIADPDAYAPESAEELPQLPANMYIAGADTTVSALQTFFLAMVLHPSAQKRAQAELDAVLGAAGRLPQFEDEDGLPYVGALVKEVLRWHPVLPLGIVPPGVHRERERELMVALLAAIPHRLVSDDSYEGHFIPAGSIVLGNSWAILHDPATFPDPSAFAPERWLAPELARRFPDAAFGFGRRICPGRFMARSSVWIAVASILAVFDIERAEDEFGNEVGVEEEYSSGLVSYPKAFKCSVKLRSEAASALVTALGKTSGD
ncbi:CyP450 monooxygenase [Amylostereum chailletii]|nr:CyP450 monooxygenase [Amylostereum chailletii]